CDEDLDAGSFMWDFHRSLRTDELPDGETVISVTLSDVENHGRWWVIAGAGEVDLCTDDPGKDVDFYLHAKIAEIAEVWMGDVDVRDAISQHGLKATGSHHLMRTIVSWFPQSRYSKVRPKRMLE
ncbi:hypothetical protein, partial [Erythrobacter ani]